MLIAGRSRSENHCPVHESGQVHGPSAASGAEKVFAAPGQRQDHAAPRAAEPKAAQKARGGPVQYRDHRRQYRPFPALRQEIRRGLHAAERCHHPAPALHRDFQGQGRRQHGTGVQGVHSQEIAAGGTALNPQGYCRKQGKGGGPQR